MRRPSVYLDTSVISALFDERTPERQTLTEEFWEKIQDYDMYLSEITEKEMEAASDTERENDSDNKGFQDFANNRRS